MVPRDVEVAPDEVLVGVGGPAKLAERIGARIVVVLVLEDAQDLVYRRFVSELLAGGVHREPGRPQLAGEVGRAEEERLVLDDRAAETEAALLVLELRDGAIVGTLANPVLVAAEEERRAAQRIRAALGNGVDAAAGEASLTHVVRRDDQLDFLNCVETDRRGLRRSAGRTGRTGEAEQVVVRRAIDLQPVVAEAVARHRDDRGAVAGART